MEGYFFCLFPGEKTIKVVTAAVPLTISRKQKEGQETEAKRATMSDHIPIEIVTGILLRLPVVSLFRFRCVSKQWRSIIDSSSFSKLQIQHSTSTTKNATLVLCQPNDDQFFFKSYINGLRRKTLINFQDTTGNAPVDAIFLYGSCNGLLCSGYGKDRAMIYSVATQKSHITPSILPGKLRMKSTGNAVALLYDCAYGFGYDSVSDEYKVLRVFHTMCQDKNYLETQVIQFGVRSNSSETVEIPYVLYQKIGAFLGGAVHWVAAKLDDLASPKVIIGFDLGLGECKEIPQPEYAQGGGLSLRVGELGNCLCIFDNCNEKFVDLWMMKEYCVKESWMKLFSVPYPGLCYKDRIKPRGLERTAGDGIRALGFSMTGREVLLQVDGKGLVWYDLNKGCVVEVAIRGLKTDFFMGSVVCFGSLVSPDGKFPLADEVKTQQKKKKKKKTKKKKKNENEKRDGFLSSGFIKLYL
ncbi:F-box protein CPR1 [Linum grandiflorum]